MPPLPLTDDDIESLMAAMLHGTASAADAQRLEAILAAEPARRAAYLDRAILHAQLAATPLALGLSDRRRPHAASPLVPSGHAEGERLRLFSAGNLLRGGMALLAASVMVLLAVPVRDDATQMTDGGYDTRQLPSEPVGVMSQPAVNGRPLVRATLAAAAQPSRLRMATGADVELDAPGVFGLVSSEAGALFEGGVRARVNAPEQSYSVEAANLRIVDRGTEFRVDRIDDDRIAVTVLDGEVEVQSRLRLPLVHWSFDDLAAGGRSATDAIHSLTAVAGPAVQPIDGIVGGAASFDNSGGASLRVEGGTGDKVGTGLLSFSTGISIEALIVSRWSGKPFDYDEIWRKEDGNSRVLLSFQNDGTQNVGFSVPPVTPGPCLSFGMQITTPGAAAPRYDELDMPLDGRDGRPTPAELSDGRPHHVVATFDSFTGVKAIFIDGKLRFSHTYPAGSLIVSGGPEPAFIGSHRGSENFAGKIDELSLYDFALTADEVAEHSRRLLAGEPAIPPAALVRTVAGDRPLHWQGITRLVEGQTGVFNQHSGLPVE
jgi:ferric-dicitrate binding protein FerR (iron transport regulator)